LDWINHCLYRIIYRYLPSHETRYRSIKWARKKS